MAGMNEWMNEWLSFEQPLWFRAALVNRLMPCFWLLSGAFEVLRLRLSTRCIDYVIECRICIELYNQWSEFMNWCAAWTWYNRRDVKYYQLRSLSREQRYRTCTCKLMSCAFLQAYSNCTSSMPQKSPQCFRVFDASHLTRGVGLHLVQSLSLWWHSP